MSPSMPSDIPSTPPVSPPKRVLTFRGEDAFSDAEEHPTVTLGYDFEDDQTRQQLELLDDLQKLGVSKYLDLPQLVVVGEQSSGKSSVLWAVTDIPFPTGDSMCTRFATEIVLKRTIPTTATKIEVCIIPDVNETAERKQLLENWSPEDFDQTAVLDKTTMEALFKQAQKIIVPVVETSGGRANHHRSMNRLSSSTLRITRSGPKEINFAIVDIPGLVRGKQGQSEHRTARQLVEKYTKNIRSIIVVVIDLVDLERHEIFDVLSELPDKESRVIGVINKCDTKQQKSSDWVFDLIRNKSPADSKHYYLKEGWYGLRNRAAAESRISDAARDKLEDAFFASSEWNELNPARLGRHNLKQALIRMRNGHIRRMIPELVSEINKKLDICIANIAELGKPRKTPTAQFALMSEIASTYSRMAGSAVVGHYNGLEDNSMYARKLIRDDLEAFEQRMRKEGCQIAFQTGAQDALLIDTKETTEWAAKILEVPTYAWIQKTIKGVRAKEDKDEINPEVKARLFHDQTKSWEWIAEEGLAAAEGTVASVSKLLLEAACPDQLLRSKLDAWLQPDIQRSIDAARHELRLLLSDERNGVVTLNPLKVTKQNIYHDERVSCITTRLSNEYQDLKNPMVAEPALPTSTIISAHFLVNSLIYQNPELVGVLNTHDSLAAYYDVALYRFIDNFALQVVERHLLGPEGPLRLFDSQYVTKRLYGEENRAVLEELAAEEPAVAARREKLGLERKSLEESRKRVQGIRML